MPKPYFLSVKAILRDPQGRCLIIRRSPASKNHAGMWDLPGGKINPGEAVDAALAREIAEETGLRVEIQRVLGAGEGEMSHRRIAYLFFLVRRIDGDVRLSDEHSAYEWVDPSELSRWDLVPRFREFSQQLPELLQLPPEH